MATDQKYLFEINIDTSKSVQNIAKYQQALERLKQEEKDLKDAVKEGSKTQEQANAQMVKITQQKKAYQKEIRNEQRLLQNTMQAESELYENTLQGLRSQLSAEKDKLRYMEIGSEAYQKQIELVGELNDQVKEAEYSFGVYTRNVGNYQSAINGLSKSVKGLVSAGLVLTTTFSDENEQTEEQQKKMKNLSKAMMAFILVQKASTSATKSNTATTIANNIAKNIGVVTTERQAKAEAAAIAFKKADTIATKAVTAAQWLWNAALSANPIFLLITAIAAVVAGVALLTGAFSKSARAQKEYNTAIEQTNKLLAENELKAKAQDLAMEQRKQKITERYAKEIEAMQKSGASAETIANKKKQMEKEMSAEEDKHLKEQVERLTEEQHLRNKQLLLAQQFLATLREGTKKYKEQVEKIRELQDALNGVETSLTQVQTEQANKRIAQVEKEYQDRQSAADKAYQKAKTALENLQSVEKAHFEARKKYQYDYTKSAEDNAKAEVVFNRQMSLEEIQLTQAQKKKQLELELKYGKITKDTYKAELEVLKTEYNAFIKDLEQSVKKEQVTLLETAIKLAGGATLDRQIADIEKKYHEANKAILSDAKMSADEKAYYTLKLEEKRLQEIKALNDKFEQEAKKQAIASVEEIYKNDYRLFSENEIEKTKAQIEQLEARIKALKEAGVSSYEEEAHLISLKNKLRDLTYKSDMQAHWNNRMEQLEIEKEYYQQIINDAHSTAEQVAEAEQAVTEITIEQIELRKQKALEYLDYYSQFVDMLAAFGDREVAKAEADNDKKKKSLEKQLKAGLISQKKYDKEVAKADEELAAKQLKVKRRQAEQEKAINLVQVIINTAASIAKTAAMLGYPAAIPMIALAAAMGAIQIATIAAQPLPKAREGMIVGDSHEQGGVVINAEGGERIVAKEPARAFPELLNLLSYVGKNANIPNTGYAERVLNSGAGLGVDSQGLATMIGNSVADAIKDLNISVSVEAIDNAKTLQTRVENSAKM